MKNQEIANILYEIAYFLEMEEIPFKPYAYEKAAIVLESLEEDIGKIYSGGGIKALESLPSIGKNIAEKIEEYLKTGKVKYYQEIKKKMPVDFEELTSVEGVGPKIVKTLYQELGIRNLKDLEKAVKSHKIAPLFGFGSKTEKNILQGIRFLKRSKVRFLLGEIYSSIKSIEKKMTSLKEVKQFDFVGSLRRKRETIGDIDILISTEYPEKVMEAFVDLPGVIKVWQKGKTRSSVSFKKGFDIDLRVVPEKSYGSALQYFTGSKDHNIHTRKIAIEKGLKLNEYGLFKGNKMIAGRKEEDIYKKLGMDWIPPELREDRGEIEAALNHRLPKLVELKDIKGDLHCHSNWNGGSNSIKELREKSIQLGYQYLGIADHTKALAIEHGLDERKLSQQRKEIHRLNKEFEKLGNCFRIIQGAETNILRDGRIDIKDSALEKLDYAVAGVHSSFKISKKAMTDRIIKAMKNPFVNIISHPTGRVLKRRDEYQVDFEKILRAAKETNTVLEINASPVRLDLNDIKIKLAKEMGVNMVINSDAHREEQLEFMDFGIGQAKRGWAEKKDIINSFSYKKLIETFSKSREMKKKGV